MVKKVYCSCIGDKGFLSNVWKGGIDKCQRQSLVFNAKPEYITTRVALTGALSTSRGVNDKEGGGRIFPELNES